MIFNWADDERVARIFTNTRRAIADTGRLLLVEKMLPPTVDGSMPPHVYVDDLNSIVSLDGRLRTEPEYRALLEAAGFELGVHPLPSASDGYVLVEARPR